MADLERGANPPDFSFFAPTEDVDGGPVDGPLTYNVYRKGSDTEAFPATAYVQLPPTLVLENGAYVVPVEGFVDGRHIIALTAVDANDEESAFSQTLGFTISDGIPPNPPVLLA